MRTYVTICIALIVLIAAGIGYRVLALAPLQDTPNASADVPLREVTLRIPLHSWSFEPEHIDVRRGERIRMTIVNEDDIDHGFAIDAYDVRESIPAGKTATIHDFIVTKPGDFQFYCSMVCGAGTVENGMHKGEHRGHFNMEGTLRVSDGDAAPNATAKRSETTTNP